MNAVAPIMQERRLASNNRSLPPGSLPRGPKGLVLEAALHCFAEKNFAGGSIRDIAAAVGLKPASLYAHYKSKEEMLATLVAIGHKDHFGGIQKSVIGSGTSALPRLDAWVDAHVRFHASYPMLAIVINHELHALPSDMIREALQQREQAVNMLLDIIQRGKNEGLVDADLDNWMAAAAIGGMGMRIAHWYTHNEERSVEQISKTYQLFARRICGVQQ